MELIERGPTGRTIITPEGLVIPEHRHVSVKHFGPLFAYGHLPREMQHLSLGYASIAAATIDAVSDSPELSACLRKLLEAKDCAIRAAFIVKS